MPRMTAAGAAIREIRMEPGGIFLLKLFHSPTPPTLCECDMNLSGEYRLPLPRQTVWNGLNDPEILRQCIPGCEELVKASDTEMSAKVGLKIGPMTAKFTGKVTLSDLDPPNGYKIAGEGQGGREDESADHGGSPSVRTRP